MCSTKLTLLDSLSVSEMIVQATRKAGSYDGMVHFYIPPFRDSYEYYWSFFLGYRLVTSIWTSSCECPLSDRAEPLCRSCHPTYECTHYSIWMWSVIIASSVWLLPTSCFSHRSSCNSCRTTVDLILIYFFIHIVSCTERSFVLARTPEECRSFRAMLLLAIWITCQHYTCEVSAMPSQNMISGLRAWRN